VIPSHLASPQSAIYACAQQSSVGSVISPLFPLDQKEHGKNTVTDDSGAPPYLYPSL
jgi:hypothetical protein